MYIPFFISIMTRRAHFCVILAFICFTNTNLIAQVTPGDSSSQQNAFNNAVSLFKSSVGEGSALYNGPEYYSYDALIKSNAYFMDVNGFTPGSVYYNGAFYTGVPMLYDLYTDDVVVLLYNHFSKFYLVKEKVANFNLLGHHFINVSADYPQQEQVIKPGFYDELYKGKLEILVKWAKSIQERNSGPAGIESYFTAPTKTYFLRKGNIYYSINSQGSLFNVLKDKKKELQQFIKSGQIRYRNDPEDAMVKIASYYDSISN